MCHDICHILLYSNFFNPQGIECVSEEEKTWGRKMVGNLEVSKEVDKNGSSKSKIDVLY